MSIFVDDSKVEVPLSGGHVAIVRADIDFETDQALTMRLAPVSFDPKTREPTIGQLDLASMNIELVRAYLLAIRAPDGTEHAVPPERVGKIRKELGDEIVEALRKRRGESEEGKDSSRTD